MIQRIQSVFLLLAALAAGFQLLFPFLLGQSALAVFADGRFNVFDNPGLLGLSILSGVLGLVSIFLFGNRPVQARVAGLGLLVSILSLVLLGFTLYQIYSQLPSGAPLRMGAGLGLAPLAMLLFLLALRAIWKDEALVKSMNRLR
jgi:hypothetical protein